MNEPVKYPLAKLLKEKGFDVPVRNYYLDSDISKQIHEGFEDSYWGDNRIVNWNKDVIGIKPFYGFNSAPTIAEVVMWINKKYHIWIYVECDVYGESWYPKVLPSSREVWYNYPLRMKIEEFTRYNNDYFNCEVNAYENGIEYTLNNFI